MKVLRIYKCIVCEHQLKTRERSYRSGCPKCGGDMFLHITEIRGQGNRGKEVYRHG